MAMAWDTSTFVGLRRANVKAVNNANRKASCRSDNALSLVNIRTPIKMSSSCTLGVTLKWSNDSGHLVKGLNYQNEVSNESRKANRSAWFIEHNEAAPYFVTAYPLRERKIRIKGPGSKKCYIDPYAPPPAHSYRVEGCQCCHQSHNKILCDCLQSSFCTHP